MAKKARRAVPVTNRRALSRREREERYRRAVYIAAAVLAALVVGVFAWGAYGQWVLLPAAPVATVNGLPIRNDVLDRMTRYRVLEYVQQMAMFGQQVDPRGLDAGQMRDGMREQLIEDELIRQEAKRRNIVVSDAEVQKQIEQMFGFVRETPVPLPTVAETAAPPAESTAAPAEPTATPQVEVTPTRAATVDPSLTPSPTYPPTTTPTPGPSPTPYPTATPMTEEGFKQVYADYLKAILARTGLTEGQFRELVVKTELLRSRLATALGDELPTSDEQILARHIVVATEDEAKAALERIGKGEDFAALAKELSSDEATKEAGGLLDWAPRGKLDPMFDQAAFALQPGEVSGVVLTTEGAYEIIKIEEREADRPLDAMTLSLRQSGAVDEWLSKQRADTKVIKLLTIRSQPPDLMALFQ